jgi:hypothetical protein
MGTYSIGFGLLYMEFFKGNLGEACFFLVEPQFEIRSTIQSFEAVLTELFKLESHMQDHTKKQHILQHNVFPAFEAWHLSLKPFLKKYIQQ